jgi:hypothetical protein
VLLRSAWVMVAEELDLIEQAFSRLEGLRRAEAHRRSPH